MAEFLEILVGTYEEFLLGYNVKPTINNKTRSFDMLQTFSTKAHTSSIRCLASNGDLVASGGADDRISLYNFGKRRCLNDLYVHDGTINALTFVPDGSYLISGGSDGKINLIKCSNWKLEKVFQKAHKGSSVNQISVHPSGALALSIGSDFTLRTWNLVKGRQAFATNLKNKNFGSGVSFVEFSQTGDHFAVCGEKVVEIWETAQAISVSFKQCEARITAISWISETDLLIGMDNGQLLCFNWEDESEDAVVCDIYKTRIKAMKYCDGFLATASSSGEVNLWKIIIEDKLEIEMVAGLDIGCRPISLDIIKHSRDLDIKDEPVDDHVEVKTQPRTLKTQGRVVIESQEVDSSEEEEFKRPSPKINNKKRNKKNANKNQQQNKRLKSK